MPTAAVNTFSNVGVLALHGGLEGRRISVNIAPSLVLAKGTVLGEIPVNDVYTMSTGVQASGTFTLTFNGQTTAGIARNASAATIATALTGLSTVGASNATVTLASGTPGTDAVYTITFVVALAALANPPLTANFSSLATPALASLTKLTTGQALGTFKAYASGNSDGSQIPRGILEYDCATDVYGNITLGAAASGGPFGQTTRGVPMFFSGSFSIADLVGLDANAVTLLGRIVEGTLAAGGIFRMP